ncbi:uncharacterized protein LOC130893980 [Diorhabda carinulata]|uniref:uncharacterized protein LOC130893980 n=1 Tax=Diorhabda carinulata TaxID=1163345 RepID=UPI0025A10434|nr:uncharacterized protein LOC130893980 [Diorhabda carinulata]XP_057656438.1 uncharacterized protein LOC130893980 [Diorhabda carinulata]
MRLFLLYLYQLFTLCVLKIPALFSRLHQAFLGLLITRTSVLSMASVRPFRAIHFLTSFTASSVFLTMLASSSPVTRSAKSSAYATAFTPASCSISSTPSYITFQRVGPRTDPCGTPIVHFSFSLPDTMYLSLKALTMWFQPAVLKAFRTSRSTSAHHLPFEFFTKQMTSFMAVTVDFSGWKPCCCGDNSISSEIRSTKSLSNSFAMVLIRHMGRYDVSSSGSFPGLYIKATRAVCHFTGNVCLLNRPLYIFRNASGVALKKNVIVSTSISSGPGAFFFFILLIASSISFRVKSRSTSWTVPGPLKISLLVGKSVCSTFFFRL